MAEEILQSSWLSGAPLYPYHMVKKNHSHQDSDVLRKGQRKDNEAALR